MPERKTRGDRNGRYEDGFRVMQGNREYVTYPENSSFRVWVSDTAWRYENHEHSVWRSS